jgi:hypothetical protein
MKNQKNLELTENRLQNFMMLMSLANRTAGYIAFTGECWELFLDEPREIDYVYLTLEDIQEHLNNFIL